MANWTTISSNQPFSVKENLFVDPDDPRYDRFARERLEEQDYINSLVSGLRQDPAKVQAEQMAALASRQGQGAVRSAPLLSAATSGRMRQGMGQGISRQAPAIIEAQRLQSENQRRGLQMQTAMNARNDEIRRRQMQKHGMQQQELLEQGVWSQEDELGFGWDDGFNIASQIGIAAAKAKAGAA